MSLLREVSSPEMSSDAHASSLLGEVSSTGRGLQAPTSLPVLGQEVSSDTHVSSRPVFS